MSRFLFVVPPLVGHVNPTVGVAAELTRRGHTVAWAGLPDVVRPLVGDGATVFPCASPDLTDPALLRPPTLRGPAALRFLWERFLGPLAEHMAPGVRAAVRQFRPDVLVADQQAVAGGLVAERLGVVWATSATTTAGFTSLAGLPKVDSWIAGLIGGLRHRIGNPRGTADPRMSDRLVLAFSTEALAGSAAVGERVRFVGPSLASRPAADDFPWHRLDPRTPTVLITLGTANAEVAPRFLAACAEAVRGRADRAQAVIVDPTGTVPEFADRVLVRPRVPQLALLERCDAVICHGGHNTVCEALWHGLPLVVAPIRDDQPAIAAQVTDAGAGVRVRFNRATAGLLGEALDTVLREPSHREAAGRVRESFRTAGGAAAAAAHLEDLAAEAGRLPRGR
ncbi:glycosyltransferase family 1 protein [Streptomyces sp. AV19]|uniref:glycosyltransferase n=1 Tax=Streptomyces sp. AV19 TaxID=2793068 RepID=UPI0018FE1F19|nr:glycosyltransferase [Streptomyces sp. AV19]MBH1937605.1 glycosyltransferase family 1 protein [Streptomyces sp. AV19]MDG4536462.1 glycosyltransferase [Streptomyces sp. AV19]